MELPHIDPVGLVHVPAGYRSSPRRRPWPVRAAALVLLAAFLAVGTVTTVATLGRYCLTSHAGGPVPGTR